MQFGNSKKPLVAVWMVTYNHADYIAQAVESVMLQNTTFDYKLYIGDDCSTDKTGKICKKLKELYPHKIELFLNKSNIGPTSNAQQIFKTCFGSSAKYVAMLEGDDYWTDPLKLQKQVDFLENNDDYVLCSHERIIIDERSKEIKNSNISKVDFHTQCLLFRNVVRNDFLKNNLNITNGDTFLICYLLNFGKGKILEFIGSAYRVSSIGVWSKISFEEKYLNSSESLSNMKYFFKVNKYKYSVKIISDYIIDNKIRYLKRGGKLKLNEHLNLFLYLVLRLKYSTLKCYLLLIFNNYAK